MIFMANPHRYTNSTKFSATLVFVSGILLTYTKISKIFVLYGLILFTPNQIVSKARLQIALETYWAPSSSGLGHHPLKVAARVRIPLGLLIVCWVLTRSVHCPPPRWRGGLMFVTCCIHNHFYRQTSTTRFHVV